MDKANDDLVVVARVYGHEKAHLLKSHLEFGNIPAQIKYEVAGKIYGIFVDGLGEIKILVPSRFFEKAKSLIGNEDILKQVRDNKEP